MDAETFRLINSKGFMIFVDNSIAQSHNINIDCPMFFCFAISEAEAVGKMMLSDFQYKYKQIISIHVD